MREPIIDEKVKLKDSEKLYKVESIFLTEITLVECRRGRGEKEKRVVEASDIDLIFPEKEEIKESSSKKRKLFKEKTPVKLTKEQRGQILRNLVESESLGKNFKREIIILARLVRKFPHVEFLLEGFKPVIKANSLLYWINRPEVEKLYKKFAIDLTSKVETVKLDSEKVGEDIVVAKPKPKTILDLFK